MKLVDDIPASVVESNEETEKGADGDKEWQVIKTTGFLVSDIDILLVGDRSKK